MWPCPKDTESNRLCKQKLSTKASPEDPPLKDVGEVEAAVGAFGDVEGVAGAGEDVDGEVLNNPLLDFAFWMGVAFFP